MALDPCPEEQRIEGPSLGNSRFEIVIESSPFQAERITDTIPRRLIYTVGADNFAKAGAIALVLLDTVLAVRRVWVARIVSIVEVRR